MKIVILTILLGSVVAAALWVAGNGAPWWVNLGIGAGIAGVADGLYRAVRSARTPKPERKAYPTTPR